MERYLYRGVNKALHAATNGKLLPKKIGTPFKRHVYYGEEVYYSDGSTYGESEANTVIMHQRNSSKYPSSGVSTTPILDNAKSYATHNNQYGFIYKLDRHLFEKYGVTEYDVANYARALAIPEDKEIILVTSDNGALPDEIIVEIYEV
jgi:hypothetical protein